MSRCVAQDPKAFIGCDGPPDTDADPNPNQHAHTGLPNATKGLKAGDTTSFGDQIRSLRTSPPYTGAFVLPLISHTHELQGPEPGHVLQGSGVRGPRGGARRPGRVAVAGARARASLPRGLRRGRGRGRPGSRRPGLPQQRGAGPRSGPRSCRGSGSSARSGPRSRAAAAAASAAAAAGLRMLARAVPAARAPGSPRSRSVARGPRLRPGVGGGSSPTAQPPSGPGRATAQRGAGLRGRPAPPHDGRRALRPLRGCQTAARGGFPGGARPAARVGAGESARARGEGAGQRPPSRGRGSRRSPGPACRRHGDAWPAAPPRFCDVTVSPPDVTAGRWRGAWPARGRARSDRDSVGRRPRGAAEGRSRRGGGALPGPPPAARRGSGNSRGGGRST
ncbi:translation initiation factor IF-2-like [Leopardus geoffroyi]|uniref:translation initiation factor IF-2-like n=1 Tax=Leopardus geoffroyi TaxID=46844 RepID=UPI001E264CA9|nr:translation initiation factor IF-2-like [Leopardus geoffroyi]